MATPSKPINMTITANNSTGSTTPVDPNSWGAQHGLFGQAMRDQQDKQRAEMMRFIRPPSRIPENISVRAYRWQLNQTGDKFVGTPREVGMPGGVRATTAAGGPVEIEAGAFGKEWGMRRGQDGQLYADLYGKVQQPSPQPSPIGEGAAAGEQQFGLTPGDPNTTLRGGLAQLMGNPVVKAGETVLGGALPAAMVGMAIAGPPGALVAGIGGAAINWAASQLRSEQHSSKGYERHCRGGDWDSNFRAGWYDHRWDRWSYCWAGDSGRGTRRAGGIDRDGRADCGIDRGSGEVRDAGPGDEGFKSDVGSGAADV